MIDVWVEVIDPTIPNLFSNTTGKSLCQIRPTCKGLLRGRRDRFDDNGILVIRPLPLADAWFQIPNPAFVAFLGTVKEEYGIVLVRSAWDSQTTTT